MTMRLDPLRVSDAAEMVSVLAAPELYTRDLCLMDLLVLRAQEPGDA